MTTPSVTLYHVTITSFPLIYLFTKQFFPVIQMPLSFGNSFSHFLFTFYLLFFYLLFIYSQNKLILIDKFRI